MSPVIPKINKNPIITIPTYWIIIWTLGGISFLVIQLISENRIKLPSSNGIGSKFINPSDIEIKEIKEREEYIWTWCRKIKWNFKRSYVNSKAC